MSLLETIAVSKRFAGIAALNDIELTVDAGEAVGLIGPNGAGKTTFFNCILGLLRPDAGRVVFGGRDITRAPVYRRARMGLARTFQRVELFTGMTVRDHLLVAERCRRGDGRLWKDILNLGSPRADELALTQATLDLLGLDGDADRPIEALSLGRSRLVELGRALMTDPQLLLLDEPSSGLDRRETDELVKTLREVQKERGAATLLVEHDVEMVQSFASRLCVLDFGTVIASGPTEQVLDDPTVRKAYLGDVV